MNVLCEVSLLGFCGDDASKITGMPRTICELVARLRALPDLDLSFCATEEPARTFEFLARHRAFAGAQTSPCALEGEISPDAALMAQVFHSTHAPIPATARNYPHLAVVQTVYDMIPWLLPATLPPSYGRYYRDIVARLRPDDTVITISESAKADFCEIARFDPARVHVTPLAADPMQFRPIEDSATRQRARQKYGVPDAPYLLSLCTFEPRKNLRHTIRAFARLVQQQPEVEVNLVLAGGQGWKFEPILAEIEGATAIRERIIVAGYVAEDDLAAIYSGALAFVYPSLYEGFGLPPLEAMQCGVPVISSNVSSLPEVMGNAGILLDPRDVDTLSAAMWELLQSPRRRDELAARSLIQAKKFSWERCALETLRVYQMDPSAVA